MDNDDREPAMEYGDWRMRVKAAGSRKKNVNKIMGTLKTGFPFFAPEGLLDLEKIAVGIEERIYSTATSQSDYMRQISLRILTPDGKSQKPIPNSPNGNTPA